MALLLPLAMLAKKRGGDDARIVGGKGARLVWLAKHEFPVPRTWILPASAFVDALRNLPDALDPKSLLRIATGKNGASRAAEVRRQILEAPLSSELVREVESWWSASGNDSPWGFAVRSSATCEDGSVLSMAGLAETVLGVSSRDQVLSAIRTVWASLASGRALAYLVSRGVREVSMAVVLQKMVETTAAGVMFTRASELGGARDERVINANFGLGMPVVSGVVTPDMIRMDHHGRVVDALLAHKTKATILAQGKLVEVDVPEPDRSALTNEQLVALATLAKRLEKLDPRAWDVEFACDEQHTWMVQVRPVTHSGFPKGGDEQTLWSNANVGESLPGVATPLTWSVAGAFSEAGFRRAFATLGCRLPKDAHLVSDVHGRIYLNISEFLRVAAQVPWIDPRTLLDLAGCTSTDALTAELSGISHRTFYARLPVTAVRLTAEQFRLDVHVERFERFAERALRHHREMDLAILPDNGVARRIRDTQALLARTGTMMLTCASSALGTHLALQALVSRVAPIGADRLAQGLTVGIRDLESARPAIGIMRIAEIARRDPPALQLLVRHEHVTFGDVPDGPTRRALLSFLDLYGDRAVREAELSTPRWREDPTPLLRMLQVALRSNATLQGGETPIDAALGRAKGAAGLQMDKILPRLSLLEQTALRHLVARAQRAARLRERMRAWVTRVLALLREAFLDADRRLARLDADLPPESVFFLTVDEVVHALKAEQRTLAPLVAARRAEYLRNVARPDPPQTFVGTPPSAHLPPGGGDVLRGIPASAGVVEGLARIVTAESMGELQAGEVLVVHTTDVGWTPLFLSAAAVVTELGGPLSHAAIVAREFGVPSVVNVPAATRVLRSGDRVRVDGDRGIVERLS